MINELRETYIILIVPRISQKTVENDHSSLNLALHDTISISTVRVVIDQSECIVLATRVVNLEESNLCIIDSWKICADGISRILLSEYGSAGTQQKE
jgi:riboflavin biosynthesis pyrimidine reductase